MGGQGQKLGWAWALVAGGSPEELAGAVAARTAATDGAGEAPTGEDVLLAVSTASCASLGTCTWCGGGERLGEMPSSMDML